MPIYSLYKNSMNESTKLHTNSLKQGQFLLVFLHPQWNFFHLSAVDFTKKGLVMWEYDIYLLAWTGCRTNIAIAGGMRRHDIIDFSLRLLIRFSPLRFSQFFRMIKILFGMVAIDLHYIVLTCTNMISHRGVSGFVTCYPCGISGNGKYLFFIMTICI